MTSSRSYSNRPIKSWENRETSQSGESFTERMKILSLLQIRLILCEELKRNYGNFFSIDALESNDFCKADDKQCFDQCREELTYQPQFIDICSKVSYSGNRDPQTKTGPGPAKLNKFGPDRKNKKSRTSSDQDRENYRNLGPTRTRFIEISDRFGLVDPRTRQSVDPWVEGFIEWQPFVFATCDRPMLSTCSANVLAPCAWLI